MMQVETDCRRENGVTFVRGAVTNTRTTIHRARLESTLDGPTWPPKRDGTVVPEWRDGVWEATIRPGDTLGLGFASPAAPKSPALTVTDLKRVDSEAAGDNPVDSLTDWAPPRGISSVDN
ncbi:hypothetical protein [Haloarcula salinisoli]|uniref:Uncharacterized protein n=1 Tax=Haloarcula salinisoli TaxID=2487746 RepID=A0A8J7YKW7_9EURY|nr:hypothetical protein [Halomicroarcula salinisoli]MBX0288074.1 hypothetical protein [Halomicroarcula salinisoli]MBX0305206.1 hypothetical protein [Halomicroarcula salinisoli]